MNILLLTTRHPYRSPVTGRKRVLQTIVSALTTLGNELHIVALDKSLAGEESIKGIPVKLFKPPGIFRMVLNLFKLLGKEPWSLNEILFWNPTMVTALQKQERDFPVDLVIVDMIRMAPYAAALGVHWHLDLDDLLSSRYSGVQSEAGLDLLGFFGERIPAVLRPVLIPLAASVMNWEGKRIQHRERYWTRLADSVSLVNPDEGDLLSSDAGKMIHWLPMSVPQTFFKPMDQTIPRDTQKVVFVGGGNYHPNYQTMKYVKDHLIDLIKDDHGHTMTLEVIGQYTSEQKGLLEHPKIVFHGYVDDLVEALHSYTLFFAPIQSGTGIKTKVLEAMAAGLVLLISPLAASGIGLEHMVHAYIADEPGEYVAGYQLLCRDQGLRNKLTENARRHAHENFSDTSLQSRWSTVLEQYSDKDLP